MPSNSNKLLVTTQLGSTAFSSSNPKICLMILSINHEFQQPEGNAGESRYVAPQAQDLPWVHMTPQPQQAALSTLAGSSPMSNLFDKIPPIFIPQYHWRIASCGRAASLLLIVLYMSCFFFVSATRSLCTLLSGGGLRSGGGGGGQIQLPKIVGKLQEIAGKLQYHKQPCLTLKVQQFWTGGSDFFFPSFKRSTGSTLCHGDMLQYFALAPP